jgi:hypothetical protein
MSGKLMGALFGLELTKAQRAVAIALADHGNDDGSSIFPSLGLVAWKVELSERQVQRILRKLEQIGLLVKVAEASQHRPVEYRMHVSATPARPAYDPNPRGDTQMSPLKGRHVPAEENGRGDISTLRGDISSPRGDTQMSPEPSIEPSVEPSTQQARAKLALGVRQAIAGPFIAEVFEHWRHKLRDGSPRVQLTERRFEVMYWRLVSFSVDELTAAIEGAAQAVAAGVLDYGHKDTEIYRIVMDDEHVRGWIAYKADGDVVALNEMLACEMPKAKVA